MHACIHIMKCCKPVHVQAAGWHFDCAYNLPAGGGLAIVNADSHETLTEILSAYPLQPWVEYEVLPLSDLKHSFDITIKALGG